MISNHQKIDKNELFRKHEQSCEIRESSKEPKSWRKGWKERREEVIRHTFSSEEEIGILSSEEYIVFFKKDRNREYEKYYVWSRRNKEVEVIFASEVRPKSVREELHNIQENKKAL